MRAAILVTFVLLAGCASSLERVQGVRDSAPEWYEARKVEISGKDYPRISNIPVVTEVNRPGQQLNVSRADTLKALNMFMNDPRATGPEEDASSMLAWATKARQAVDSQVPASDFLTDEEVEALKSVFDTPRGRL
jgi:hypothetical protein